jgi:hypothetical protein
MPDVIAHAGHLCLPQGDKRQLTVRPEQQEPDRPARRLCPGLLPEADR